MAKFKIGDKVWILILGSKVLPNYRRVRTFTVEESKVVGYDSGKGCVYVGTPSHHKEVRNPLTTQKEALNFAMQVASDEIAKIQKEINRLAAQQDEIRIGCAVLLDEHKYYPSRVINGKVNEIIPRGLFPVEHGDHFVKQWAAKRGKRT